MLWTILIILAIIALVIFIVSRRADFDVDQDRLTVVQCDQCHIPVRNGKKYKRCGHERLHLDLGNLGAQSELFKNIGAKCLKY